MTRFTALSVRLPNYRHPPNYIAADRACGFPGPARIRSLVALLDSRPSAVGAARYRQTLHQNPTIRFAKLCIKFGESFLQHVAIFYAPALVGSPRADLAAERPRLEILIRFFCG